MHECNGNPISLGNDRINLFFTDYLFKFYFCKIFRALEACFSRFKFYSINYKHILKWLNT